MKRALRVALPCAACAVAREVDAAVGQLLHVGLDLPAFVPQALRLVDPSGVAAGLGRWVLGGLAAWLVLSLRRARRPGAPLSEALAQESDGFTPLWLPPALTLLALASLAWRPAYPYGFTLPVALTQDWSAGVAVAVAAFLVVPRLDLLPRPLPPPGARDLALLAFLAYALITPEWARPWEGHPGNEPKTLRMAVSLGLGLTLDVEGVSAGMEALPARPVGQALAGAGETLLRETGRMLRDLLRGPGAVGRGAIRATHLTRQTVRGKEGGVFHVLAPGPSFLLAPLLRLDRALNLHLQTPGRLALTVLAWNGLAALLVAALFQLLRDVTGRPGLAAALAGFLALVPPFVFYAWQFYPEMLGALALTVLLRQTLFGRRGGTGRAWAVGLLLATLPWLHQKFLPLWGVLALMALVKLVDELGTLQALLGLVLPQLATLFLFALYNYAITGSVRPDALFLAWGPAGISSRRVGQGLLGLMLDARYGLLPWAPLYLLAGAGLIARGPAARRLRLALPAAFAYYLTVASADNWSGAVCNLGRYAMPVVPVLIAFAALALAAAGRAAVRGLALLLAGLTALFAAALVMDPHAANDCALLIARGTYADGNVYLPNLFIRTWADAAPGLWARILAWLALASAIAWVARPRATGPSGAAGPGRALAGVAATVLLLAALLERWPSARGGPVFPDAMVVDATTTAFLGGPVDFGRDEVRVGPGEVDLLVRSREPLDRLTVTVEGSGLLRLPDGRRIPIPGAGAQVSLPLRALASLTGRRGATQSLARQRFAVEGPAPVALRLSTSAAER